MFETMPDAIVNRTIDDRIAGWNAAAERIYGFAAHRGAGLPCSVFVPADLADETKSILEQLSSGKSIANFRTHRLDQSGTRIPVNLEFVPVRRENGEIAGFSEVMRVQSTGTEQIFRLAVEASPNGIVMVDPRGKIALVNSAAERLFGYRSPELVGEPVGKLVPARFSGGHEVFLQEFVSTPATRPMGNGGSYFGRRKDGSEFPVEIGLNPFVSGDSVMILATIVDVTHHQIADKQLRQNQDFFAKAFKASPAAMSINLLSDCTFIDVNDTWTTLFGYESDEVVGNSALDRNFLRDGDVQNQVLETIRRDGHIRNFEVDIRRKDGSLRHTLVSMEVLDFNSSKCVLTNIQDITELKTNEQKLVASREQLRQLSARLDQVVEEESKRIASDVHDLIGGDLVGLRHDIQTVKKLLSDAPDHSNRPKLLEKLDEMTKLATATLNSAKRISSELHPAELNFLGLIPALRSEAQRFQERSGIECRFESRVEDSTVEKNQSAAVYRVFQETLRNVLRHAKATAVVIKVGETDNRLTLTVADNGIGMTDAQINAFDSLGLLSMRERISNVSGTIEIGGTPGGGTTVKVVIPTGR